MINRNACAALAAAVVLAAVLLPSASATEREDLLQEALADKTKLVHALATEFKAQHQTRLHATSDMLQTAALKAQSDVKTKQMHAAKMEYHENKKAKGVLRAQMADLKAVEPKDEATHKLLADTKAKLKTLHKDGAGLKAKFQSLYSISFGGSRFSYTNDPTKPGVSASNDGGMYEKYGFGVNPVGWENFQGRGDNAQHCEVMTEGMPQCADVEMSGTCQDMPSYYDCDGDGCAYYTDFPEECGLHDEHCGDDESLENPCHSAGHSSEGCCACQHHGTDAGCGTWETCSERLQKEAWTDREGRDCNYYVSNPDRCDNDGPDGLHTDLTFKGHDAKECCPTALGRSCGKAACAAGQYVEGDECADCAAGTYNPKDSTFPNHEGGVERCLDCPSGHVSATKAASCEICPAGTFVGAPDECADCLAGTFSKGGAEQCLDCPSGHVSATKAESCEICPAGKFVAAPDECSMCPANTYNADQGAPDQSWCEPCGDGYESDQGATGCTIIPMIPCTQQCPTCGHDCGTFDLGCHADFVACGLRHVHCLVVCHQAEIEWHAKQLAHHIVHHTNKAVGHVQSLF